MRGMAKLERADPEIRAQIAGWVRWWKHEEKKTQADIARLTGLDKGTVSRLCNGEPPPSLGLDQFVAIHRGLKISANWMLDDIAPKPGSKPRWLAG